MRYRIEHETRLQFAQSIQEHQCEVRLTPRQDDTQQVISFNLTTEPPTEIFSYTDAFGNRVHHFGVIPPHRTMITRVVSEVETLLENPFDYPMMEPAGEEVWYANELQRNPRLWQYILHQSAETPLLSRMNLTGLHVPERDLTQPVQNSVQNAMHWVARTLAYRSGVTDTHTPLADVLAARSGVCQDFAHLLISLLRSWRIPARYVMGYLDPGVAKEEDINGDQASHAWVEVLIPAAGWRGYDATHELVANDTYIPIAVGRDSRDAAPQRGSFKGDESGQSPKIKLMIARQQQ